MTTNPVSTQEPQWEKVAEKHKLIGGFCHGGEIFIPSYAVSIDIPLASHREWRKLPKRVRRQWGFFRARYVRTVLHSAGGKRVVFRVDQSFPGVG